MSASDSVIPVPENKIFAYVVPGVKKDVSQSIRPCKATRDWMDETPSRYAYRCIPLTASNTMGWEILNPVDVEMSWTGVEGGDQLHIKASEPDPFSPRPHFGTGTVTWYIPFLFRTHSDYGLIVSGPSNHDKKHITPLDAFVRTDWVSFPFTVNWRITEPNKTIKFKAGEPICRVMPYPLALLNDTQMELRNLEDDPAFMARVQQWDQTRQQNYQKQREAEEKWMREGRKPDMKELWNSQYAKGQGSDISNSEHQNVFKCADIEDKRTR
ncbi:hypothetical protein EYS14_15720 [Alteromonadaceae bacterium M269]|nr:hypothetical protein EYS14_15720 [Alteromonadaceae bacterium M269]